MRKIIYLSVLSYIFSVNLCAQSERYTKGAENGYSWFAMEESQLPYNNTKYKYLNSILEKDKIMQSKFPGSAQLLCEKEKNQLLESGKSDNFSLEDVIKKIDEFYSVEDNRVIPIIFAYCYVIKKEAGFSQKQLSDYIEDVLIFCEE
jgi:hypothetical protein